MKNLHEYVYYLDGLPIRVFVHNQHYVPPHWHKEIELLLVLSGRAQISIGQLRLDAAEDDVVIVNCNEVHSTSSAGEEPLIIAGLQIDPEFCGLLLPDIARIWFRNGALLEREGKQSAMDWLRYYLARIIWETIETDEGYQVALQGMAYLIISYLTRNCRQAPAAAEAMERSLDEFGRIRPILDYIDAHYMDKLSLDEIARSQNMSYFYLSHLFKAQVGVSLSEYLNSIRMGKALDLLAYSDQKIIDIVYTCGFSGPDFFYKAFKEKQRCTPLEYRSKHRLRTPSTLHDGNSNFGDTERNTIPQAEIIVARLFFYLERQNQDRSFSKSDRDALMSLIQRNNLKKLRCISGMHFTPYTPRSE